MWKIFVLVIPRVIYIYGVFRTLLAKLQKRNRRVKEVREKTCFTEFWILEIGFYYVNQKYEIKFYSSEASIRKNHF